MSNYEVGYGKPPRQHQFAKGVSGNIHGRRGKKRKPPPDNSEAAILQRLDQELIDYNGKKITKREVELRVLQMKALKGDPRALMLLDKKRTAAGLDKAAAQGGGGIFLLPAPMPPEEWEVRAFLEQAKFRGQDPEGLAALERSAEKIMEKARAARRSN
jgi:hypothetical protein